MKVLKIILSVVAVVFVLAVGIGLFLPSRFEVSRSIDIKAPPSKVYALVADPREWAKWSAWNERDPAMKIAYTGPPWGKGARWAWESASEGKGSMEFTRADTDRLVEYVLVFPEFGMRSTGRLVLEPAGGATHVTWSMAGDVGGNPLKRYFSVLMDRMVGPDFEKGLANLKRVAEKP